MTWALYPLVGVGALVALVCFIVVIYWLWRVLFVVGFLGLLTVMGAGIVTGVQGSDPSWLPILALCSLACVALSLPGMEDDV